MIVFGLCLMGFIVFVVLSSAWLPDRVATHFDWEGKPNGWMSKYQYLAFIEGMGWALPLILEGLFYAMRYFPNGLINFPGDREYWLAPERRADTLAYVFRQSFWMTSMMIGLVAGLHYLTLQANRLGGAMAHVSMSHVFLLVGCFVFGMVTWIAWLYHHFRRR